MASENKRWRPGRNLLTLILVIILFALILLCIYVPTTIVSNYKAGKVTYFQDVSSVTDLSNVYDEEEIVYYDNSSDYKDWVVKLEAYQYTDVQDALFIADNYNKRVETTETDTAGTETTKVTYEDEFSGDKINCSITISLPEDKSDLSDYSDISSKYVIYASLSVATNWIGDHVTLSSPIKVTENNIKNSKKLTGNTLKCKASYPARRTICWPVVKNVDSPDVYLYLYFKDSKGKSHQAVIRYTYKEYMTADTIGAIVNPHD